MFRALPAQQGLRAGDAAIGIHLRLVIQLEFLLLQTAAQRTFQFGTGADGFLHFRIKKAQGIAPGALGLIHGEVRPFQQLFHRVVMAVKQHGTHAAGVVVHVAQHGVGAGQCFQDMLADGAGLQHGLGRVAVQAFQHQHEFVATQPRHGIARAQAVIQPLRHFLQQAVALVMAQGVVEGFEIVQVDEQQGPGMGVMLADFQRHLQAVQQQATVGQPGEWVVKGQALDLVLCRLALGNVAHGAHVVADRAILRQHRADAEPFRIGFPVFAPVPDFPLPGTQFLQALPHALVKRSVVTAGLQQADFLPHHFVGTIAGDFAERAIHPQDGGVAVGHHHAFLCFKGGGGNA